MINFDGLTALALYAGLNGIILIWLGMNVGKTRLSEKVSIGDEGNGAIIRAMRGHANFVETAPFALLLILIAALLGSPTLLIHFLGATLFIGRLLHAMHFTKPTAPRWQRFYGFILTYVSLLAATLNAIWLTVSSLLA